MRAIILAGGQGIRLRPVIPDVPKPMAPIRNKPFLVYLLDYLQTQGFTQVTLSLGYQASVIRDYFQDQYGLLKLDYVIEKNPLGTGGAIVKALRTIKITSEPIFVLNGDTFLEVNFKAMYEFHQQQASLITMAVCRVDDASRYGRVSVENNRVVSFHEKGESGSGLINAGVYLLDSRVLNQFKIDAAFSFEKDFLMSSVNCIAISAFITEDYFIDIGVPEDYSRAEGEMIGKI